MTLAIERQHGTISDYRVTLDDSTKGLNIVALVDIAYEVKRYYSDEPATIEWRVSMVKDVWLEIGDGRICCHCVDFQGVAELRRWIGNQLNDEAMRELCVEDYRG